MEYQGSIEFTIPLCFLAGANLICNETTGPADKKRPRIEIKMVSFFLCCLVIVKIKLKTRNRIESDNDHQTIDRLIKLNLG